MPHEELHHLSDFSDERLLITMRASVNDARHIVRSTLKLIEHSRIMLRELDGPPLRRLLHAPKRPGSNGESSRGMKVWVLSTLRRSSLILWQHSAQTRAAIFRI
jgi:hypothetical protein